LLIGSTDAKIKKFIVSNANFADAKMPLRTFYSYQLIHNTIAGKINSFFFSAMKNKFAM